MSKLFSTDRPTLVSTVMKTTRPQSEQEVGCGLNPLTPNDHYSGRTALLTSKVAFYIFIQQI